MSKPVSKMVKAELVAECNEDNMSADGTVKHLRERLLAWRASKDKEALEVSAASQQPSVPVETNTMEAILIGDIDVDPEASDKAAADTCDKGLRTVLDEEGLTIHDKPEDGGKFAANVKGKSIFDLLLKLDRDRTADRQAHKEEISGLKQNFAADQQALKEEISGLKQKILGIQRQITTDQQAYRQEKSALEATLAILETRTTGFGYRDIRSRFLSFYKRNRGSPDEQDWKIIRDGKEAAHGGDALFDATLYQRGIRSVEDTFVAVYCISYTEVLRYRRFTQFKLYARF